MIADYVNDQIDVVGRAFLGLTPRLRPLPRPQVRPDLHRGLLRPGRHLLQHPPDPRPGARQHAARPRAAAAARRAGEAPGARRGRQAATGRAGATASRCGRPGIHRASETPRHRADGALSRRGLRISESRRRARRSSRWASWRGGTSSTRACWPRGSTFSAGSRSRHRPAVHPTLRDAAAGKLAGPALERAAGELQQVARGPGDASGGEAARTPEEQSLADACVLRFRADDPHLSTDSDGRVTLWPNRSGLPSDARPAAAGTTAPSRRPPRSTAIPRPVLRFDGHALLEAPRTVPPTGSLFVVFQAAKTASGGSACSAGKIPTSASTGLASCPIRAARCTRSCATTASRAISSMRDRRRDSKSSASPGVRTARPCIATARRPARRRASRPFPPTRRSRPCIWAGRAPGAVPVPRGRRGDPRLQPATRRRRTQAGRGRVAPTWFEPADPNAAERPRSPTCTTNCSPPGARSGCRRTRGKRACLPRTDRGWTT